jgi:glutathione S-transferase
MSALTLYYAPQSRSMTALWMLEEIGQPYDIHKLDLQKGEQLKSGYLAINPMGKVPALKHKNAIITESAAICTYLADEFPQAKLNVPVGNPQRGVYLKWLFFGPSIFEPAMTDVAFPRKEAANPTALGYRPFDQVLDIMAKAVSKGPYLMGEQFTAADVVLGSGIRYGTMFKLVPERKEFADYIARFSERPALKRAMEKDHGAKAA